MATQDDLKIIDDTLQHLANYKTLITKTRMLVEMVESSGKIENMSDKFQTFFYEVANLVGAFTPNKEVVTDQESFQTELDRQHPDFGDDDPKSHTTYNGD